MLDSDLAKLYGVEIKIMDVFVSMRKYISNNLLEQQYINELILKDSKKTDLLEETFNGLKKSCIFRMTNI